MLFNNPEILILDEATYALDSRSEAYIKKVNLSLRERGKTVIIITHRIHSVDYADQIVLLDQGQVKEMGSPRDLLAKQQGYYSLVNGHAMD